MRRLLSILIPAPQLPDGYTLRPLADETEIAAAAALHQEVFATSSGAGTEQLAMMRDPEYLPALDLVMPAPDGALAAFGLGAINYDDDWCLGGKAGWIELIGTRPAFRRRGLGRALLLRGAYGAECAAACAGGADPPDRGERWVGWGCGG